MADLVYFTDLKSEAIINRRYRELAKKYHPDRVSDEARKEEYGQIMAQINEEHREALILHKHIYSKIAPNETQTNETQTNNIQNTGNKLKTAVQNAINAIPEAQRTQIANEGKQFINNVTNIIADALIATLQK